MPQVSSQEQLIVGFHVTCGMPRQILLNLTAQPVSQCRDNRLCNLVLNRKNIGQVSGIGFRPQVRIRLDFY